ncbi:MAG: AraC family transcriptional regulator [Clostridia bacterium]|nr:AraC family transcriptional regulator [Clostridia bacterium]
MGQVSLQEQFTQLNITRGLPQGAFVSRSHYLAVARGAGGRVSVDGVAYTLEPGDVLLLPPFRVCYSHAGCEEFLAFSFGTMALCLADPRFPALLSRTARFDARSMDEGLSMMVASLGELVTEGQENAAPLCRLRLTELLLRLASATPDMPPETPVSKAVLRLTERLDEEVTLDRVASEVGVTKFHLCRLFRKESGYTPHAYFGYARVARVLSMETGGLSLATLARAVGFRDYSTFYRTYKRVTGQAPVPRGEDKTI